MFENIYDNIYMVFSSHLISRNLKGTRGVTRRMNMFFGNGHHARHWSVVIGCTNISTLAGKVGLLGFCQVRGYLDLVSSPSKE